MRLALYEWRKFFCLPALWGFLALSLLFNGLLILSFAQTGRDFFNQTSADAALLGQRVGPDFFRELAALPDTENRRLLLESALGMENIFEGYDTGLLKDFYAGVVQASPSAAAAMGWKYDLLAGRAEHLAQTGAAMDLYAGPATEKSHQFLFGTLMRCAMGQAAIAAMLATLHLLGQERLRQTEGLAFSSRTGRGLRRTQVLCTLSGAPLLFALTAIPTLGLYLACFDYGGIWGASVSSQFNFLTDLMLTRPFLTWADFTVGQYLAACLALGAALTAVFALLAALCALLAPGPYPAALAAGLLCLGGLALTSALGELRLWAAYLLFCFQPTLVWLCCGGWFTELGLNAVLPFQESLATAANLIILGAGVFWALRRFGRKDVNP